MNEEIVILDINDENKIKELIHEFRGKQVMLDSDIAQCFNVPTSRLNEQMKRNKDRFPEDFCFQLNSFEFRNLTSQNAISSYGGRRHLPYVYTEQGIIALAGVLRSAVADQMSVRIARVFINMRTALIEYKDQLEIVSKYYGEFIDFKQFTVSKLDDAFTRIEKLEPKKEVLLLSGEYFTAFEEVIKLIERAKESLVLVDPYADDKSLMFLSHKKPGVKVTIYKSKNAKLKAEEVDAFSKQYGEIKVNEYNNSHNRYLIIDSDEVYDLGTSLNRIGGKDFTMNKMEINEVSDVLIGLFTL